MRLVMTLLVRNEEDIIEENLIFHKALGVDFFVVTDHSSTDRTTEILTRYRDKGWLELLFVDAGTYNQGVWVTEMARRAYTVHEADWVINNDADEFWMPQEGTFKNYFDRVPPETGMLYANRLDFYYRPFKMASFYEALLFREWLCRWKKCCHRGAPDITVEIGNHGASSKELSEKNTGGGSEAGALKILHYPIRSYTRYKKKMIESARFMIDTPGIPAESGFHWKTALRQIEDGTFDQQFQDKIYTQEKIEAGIKNNSIVMDDSLQRFFLDKTL